MKALYTETILLLERLHRRFLDVVKTELDHLHISDINNVQTLILHNIGDHELTVTELTNRGYYLGSNVSYNVKKLVENGYLIQEQSKHDKRATRVKLSEKGVELSAKIDELYVRNVDGLTHHNIGEQDLRDTNETLQNMEQYWAHYINNIYRIAG